MGTGNFVFCSDEQCSKYSSKHYGYLIAMVIFKIVGIGLMVVHELVKDIPYDT